MSLHTSSYFMQYTILSLQRDLRERIDKLGSSSWGIRVKCLSKCGWKLGKQLIEKNINIASRVVRHARPQHNCILISFFNHLCFLLVYYSCLFTFICFPFISIILHLLLLTNWVFPNASTNKVFVDSTLGLLFNLYYL